MAEGAPNDEGPERQASTPAETGYTPGDDIRTRWSNFFAGLTGKMTPEGLRLYRVDADKRHEVKHCKKCEKNRDYLLDYSPIIRYMTDNIRQLGGNIDRDNIHCMRCDSKTRHTGGFHPRYGIKLCANEIRGRGRLEDTLAHEMIHAYDHLRFKIDWNGNVRHHACSEIRASSLSGECRFLREFFGRRQWRVAQQHQACVRRRAALSIAARPDVRDDAHAARIVNEVWESCFNDPRPFEEIYR